jgi:hypothetical protein
VRKGGERKWEREIDSGKERKRETDREREDVLWIERKGGRYG